MMRDGGIQSAHDFRADPDYTTGLLDDVAMYNAYLDLYAAGDVRVRPSQANWPRRAAKPPSWHGPFNRLADNIEKSLSVPYHHQLWPVFRWYRHFNINDCPVTTPECLVFFTPEWNERPHLMAWRKCCVEHRRLLHLAHWFADFAEGLTEAEYPGSFAAFTRYAARYYVSDGALLGIVRDGGVLNACDTDVDMYAPQGSGKHLFQALKHELSLTRPSFVGAVTIGGGEANRIAVTASAPPRHTSGVGVVADSHMEVFFENRPPDWAAPSAQVEPMRRCWFYGRKMWIPGPAEKWLTRVFKASWRKPTRSPLIRGMFGLHWCDGGPCCDGSDYRPVIVA